LLSIDHEVSPAPNRLIALDEFGAFIGHDRLARLGHYLRSRAKQHSGDQVVVILPLSFDPAEAPESPRTAEVNDRGYFAEAFEG
jgi:hypothetical protein